MLITDERCLEAMRRGNFETAKIWYREREIIANRDQTGKSRIDVLIRLGILQKEAGFFDLAHNTLNAAMDVARRQYDDEALGRIRDLIAGLPASKVDEAKRLTS